MNKTTQSNSIFLHVLNNLDSKGRYVGEYLPDDVARPYSLGNDDAELFSPDVTEEALLDVQEIYELLQRWIDNPTDANKNNLYSKVAQTQMIVILHPLLSILKSKEVPFTILKLAEEWIYTAPDREVIKFAYILCGVIGLNQIKTIYSEDLYKDLFTLARCEEFTLYLCFACYINDLRPQKELWMLARRTYGWGRALTVAFLDCNTPSKKLWLLKNGMDLKIFWPPLTTIIILETDLESILQGPELDYDTYLAINKILIFYLLFIEPTDAMPEYSIAVFSDAQTDIHLASLLTNFLRHAKNHAKSPKELLEVFAIKDRLEQIAISENWQHITPNDCHLLISKCDELIYVKDWEPEITANLFTSKKELNGAIVNFAADLDIDVWHPVFNYLKTHHADNIALQYLLNIEFEDEILTDIRYRQVLRLVEKNLLHYLDNEAALIQILQFLQYKPGVGNNIIIAALTGLYEYPRGIAALSLSFWDKQELTPQIKLAIIKAINLNENPFIDVVLNSLLDTSPMQLFEEN